MRSYTRYLRFILLGFLLPAGLWVGLVFAQLGAPTADSQWPADLYDVKTQIAQEMPSPKVLSVSGSSSLFSVSAKRIAAETGVPTVNMGTWAGISLDYLLRKAETAAKPGDTILLALEYNYFEGKPPSSDFTDFVMARDPSYIFADGPVTALRYIFGVSPQRLVLGLQAKVSPPETQLSRDGYTVKTLNAYGDETINTRPNEKMLKVAVPTNILLRGGQVSSKVWKNLAAFKARCNVEGIFLLATFPSTMHFPAYDKPAAQATLDQIVTGYKELGIPVLGTPQKFMYPKAMFFDTLYHLTSTGREQHTETLMTLLQPYLAERHALQAQPVIQKR